MALRVSSTLSPFWYAPKDQGEGEPTRFKIRGLTGLELTDVNASARRDPQSQSVIFTGESVRTALRKALMGWENFLGPDGEPVAFGADRDANIDLIPFTVMGDLFGEILNASRLDGDGVKN